MSELESNPLGLPTKTTKKWKVTSKTKRDDERRPLHPMFCPCKNPDTGKKCGNMMRNWDQMFYDQYGMCEACYLKYNSHKEDIAKEMEKQQNEVAGSHNS